ncbi:Armadillo-like helical [Cordyceps fumosorosea ARSEF 2679]|uniref:Armadillo-like helical n=1 Tax=Cordyceps fumosorosea (strain ARSEF 2679) TaxID=1081104 RepID=A0A162LQH8_CORFA|nr:Armadillo-like helical [Cordyceps fumosorosea ARSEF 2679]OAA74134.1 Armadillo-like helical [Cordyceps fumosorosea ARSEF 2679]
MSAARPDHLGLGFSSHPGATQGRSGSPSSNNNSPVDSSSAYSTRSHFGLTSGLNSTAIMAANTRSGAGSPSHDLPGSSRLFSKRAREIQAQEGISSMPPLYPWGGPPTSGNSTPLRENIPESPTDGFPDFGQLPTADSIPQTRRGRAGTLPSRLTTPGTLGAPGLLGVPSLLSAKSARATPSQSPFHKSPSPTLDHPENASGASTLLSRLRAGSLPQRGNFSAAPGTAPSPFGPSIFSSWNPAMGGRERASTLASIASVGSNGPSSPSQSHFSRDGGESSDAHMRTLDYLGLAETPQPQIATPYYDSSNRQNSRFRSYSVNNKEQYDHRVEEYVVDGVPIDQRYVAVLQDQLDATNAMIRDHNKAVQAFAISTANRPRAQTASVLEIAPHSRAVQLNMNGGAAATNNLNAAERRLHEDTAYDELPQAVAGLNLGRSNSRNAGMLGPEEQGLDGPTSALWLGGVPTSTTTSTLNEMFKSHGPILSARVLTHKNCGFVNFERVESAISAKASMNGKEIFPGAGPIRINFAKPPSASNTPGHDGAFPSPSPDPFAKGEVAPTGTIGDAPVSSATPTVPPLPDMTTDMLEIIAQFGASDTDTAQISRSIQSAIQFTAFADEIPPIREPTHTRVHDAPKLRDIRKRVDNQLLSPAEIENIAVEMLPEISELSSDYLGNTVVQKLFDNCSDELRDAMLTEIAPHMAEIGVHKNGTWAAQKIIDVCKTSDQMNMIVEYIRPYTVQLFLDQYGNYVLQGCLKYGAPFNDFIFETMLSRMWEISQGRYGARAMRACLESHHSTKEQQRMLAAAIALHSVQLATNANGALLLTWFLDTCTFPLRRTVLAPRLVPHLVHLCTHKVAYLTVLKVINQKAEPDARDTILHALFFNNPVLEAILNDQACGATLIFKVLTTPFFDETIRSRVVEAVKNVLLNIGAQPNQGYKRLMDEVGLSTRTSGTPSRETSAPAEQRRPTSRHANGGGNQQSQQQQQQQQHAGKPYYNGNAAAQNPGFDNGYNGHRADGGDPNMMPFQQYNQNMMYSPPNGAMAPGMGMPPMQYQQGMMARGGPQAAYNYGPMQAPYGGFAMGQPGTDQFRQQNMVQPNPMQMQGGQGQYAPPGFGMPVGGYGYPGMPGGAQGMGYVQQDQPNGRRGRR